LLKSEDIDAAMFLMSLFLQTVNELIIEFVVIDMITTAVCVVSQDHFTNILQNIS